MQWQSSEELKLSRLSLTQRGVTKRWVWVCSKQREDPRSLQEQRNVVPCRYHLLEGLQVGTGAVEIVESSNEAGLFLATRG